MCVCESLFSHTLVRDCVFYLSRGNFFDVCVCACVCVCVFILMFSFECARVGLFPKRRKREKRDFSNCLVFFPTTFYCLWELMVYTLIPGINSLFSHKNHRAENSSSKTSHQHHHHRPQFEKSLEDDERNVSPREDVITRRATTTCSGARRCC